MFRLLSVGLALALVPFAHAQRPGQNGHCGANQTSLGPNRPPFNPGQFGPTGPTALANPQGWQASLWFRMQITPGQYPRPPLPMNPLRPNAYMPMNPIAPVPAWQNVNPLTQTQPRVDPLAGQSSAAGLSIGRQNPLPKAEPQPIPPEKLLQRSDDEKTKYVRDALKRGWDAEQAGNKLLARVCYENAANTYPDVALTARARTALERLQLAK